jgi:addiction module HigA family antidote
LGLNLSSNLISSILKALRVREPAAEANLVLTEKRGVSPDTAWLLSEALSTSPEFWLNLQATHELSLRKPKTHIQPLLAVSA